MSCSMMRRRERWCLKRRKRGGRGGGRGGAS